MVSLSVLIVCYNSRDYILDCLEGLFRYTSLPHIEVLLLDNSDDGTLAMVNENYPQVRTFEANVNLGFGAGNNFLAQHVTGTHLLLLNPDTQIHDDAIGELVRVAEAEPEIQGWGGVTVTPAGSIDPGCVQCGPGLHRIFLQTLGFGKLLRTRLPPRGDDVIVRVLSGAFLMVPTGVWTAIGGFDEDFFMYAEDVDLSYRIRQRGGQLKLVTSSQIVHLIGSGQSHSPQRLLSQARARMQFYRKHYSTPYATAAGILTWLHAASRVSLNAIRRRMGRNALEAGGPFKEVFTDPKQWWHGFPKSKK